MLIYPHRLDHHHPLLAEHHVVPPYQGDVQPGREAHRCGELTSQLDLVAVISKVCSCAVTLPPIM